METIYLLTRGAYSEYRVIGAASSKEKAESMIVEIRSEFDKAGKEFGFDPINIEELKIDAIEDDLRAIWNVTMLINGDDAKAEMRVCAPCAMGFIIGNGIKLISGARTPSAAGVWIRCKADSAEHAIKILNEKRIHALAISSKTC